MIHQKRIHYFNSGMMIHLKIKDKSKKKLTKFQDIELI